MKKPKYILITLLSISFLGLSSIPADNLDLTTFNEQPPALISIQEITFQELSDPDLLTAEEQKLVYSQVKEASYNHFLGNDGQTILIVYAGEKNTGGHEIKVKKITADQDQIQILVQETSPKPGDFVTMAFTYPYTIIQFSSPHTNFQIENTGGDVYKQIN